MDASSDSRALRESDAPTPFDPVALVAAAEGALRSNAVLAPKIPTPTASRRLSTSPLYGVSAPVQEPQGRTFDLKVPRWEKCKVKVSLDQIIIITE